ncbi:MAG: nucleoside triphosphate pyrophosphatase [Candidatus Nanopelagicales bacterium]|nr:Maf family nucleotide pyrophosphatase [Candidatus Nanopelagicales bacterium]MDP4825799.1 Maf family nucleotide pyrophosphatase [Candidatus Nanopelagicales bacterium]MDP4887362.1 Maf family nucleotide pyrophosphatase [Candidatus Nanopelagicales bacterium]
MFILASASVSRLRLLRQAGLDPQVMVSGLDEHAAVAEMPDPSPAQVALGLAVGKATQVAEVVDHVGALVLGCDSVFEFEGAALGKPATREIAHERWRRMQGRTGQLHTGHCLIHVGDPASVLTELVSTEVLMGTATAADIDYYLDSAEPYAVAGGFTLDGLGAPFVAGVSGDPGNVIGVSLPAVRRLAAGLGITWAQFVERASAHSG